MKLTREQLTRQLASWQQAWNDHDLETVMDLFHDRVRFESWTGSVTEGKEKLRTAWRSWFEHHGGFTFIEEETFVDETTQKAVYRWQLIWPAGADGQTEKRRGLDVLHFEDGKIIRKLTYSKTTVSIDDRRIPLEPRTPE